MLYAAASNPALLRQRMRVSQEVRLVFRRGWAVRSSGAAGNAAAAREGSSLSYGGPPPQRGELL